MDSVKEKYESFKNIKVGVLTWNLAGKCPSANLDVSKVLLPESLNQQQELSLFDDSISQSATDDVDMYVVGLQEMVNLDMIGSVMCNKDYERMMLWE